MNIATGTQISVNHLYREIDAILKTGIKPNYGPPRPGDIKHSVADVSLARKLLKFEPKGPYSKGLARTIEWTRQSQT